VARKIYELTELQIKVFSNAKVYEALQKALPAAGGRLVGAFATDIGVLSQVLLLREFDDANALCEARLGVLESADPFGCGEWLTSMQSSTYAAFPTLPPPATGGLGPWYELRTYGLVQGRLAGTYESWRSAIPARAELSPFVGAFAALDGPQPRFLNIWGYATLEERSRARAQAVEMKIWPPAGGPDSLTVMSSDICRALPFSPLT